MVETVRDYEALITDDGIVAISVDESSAFAAEGATPFWFDIQNESSLVIGCGRERAIVHGLPERVLAIARSTGWVAVIESAGGEVTRCTPCRILPPA